MPRWLWILLGLGVAVVGIATVFAVGLGLGYALRGGDFAGGGSVAVIRVEGEIQSGDGDDSLFTAGTGAYSERIIDQLERAGKNPAVRAIVLRVDSPGGAVTPSDEIRNAILKVKNDHKKPVVVSMGGLAASGGYYIAAPADHIVANPTTLTGSIGVIMVIPEVQDLLDKVGVKTYVFSSGPHKDDSSGLRPLSESDEQIFQSLIEDSYNRFVTVVAEGRKLPPERVRELADGRIYSGTQAKDAGLVDSFGDLPEAVKEAGRLAGIEGEPSVIEYEEPGSLGAILSSAIHPTKVDLTLDGILGIDRSAVLHYRYLAIR